MKKNFLLYYSNIAYLVNYSKARSRLRQAELTDNVCSTDYEKPRRKTKVNRFGYEMSSDEDNENCK